MKFTERERAKIHYELCQFAALNPNEYNEELSNPYIDQIESILTPPVQDGGEWECQTIITNILFKEYPEKGASKYVHDKNCLVSREHIPSMMEEYAQLRTASLRAELEELKKEFERSEDARDVLNEKLQEAKKTISAQFHKEHSVSDSEELRAELEEAKREIDRLENNLLNYR